MQYALTLRIADRPWSGSGDQGTASFRRPSRLNLLLKGVDAAGRAVEHLVPIADGEPLQLDRSATYSFSFQAPQLTEITSVSLQFDQADLDPIQLDALAIQIVEGLTGSIISDSEAESDLVAARSLGSPAWNDVAAIQPGLRVDLYDGKDFQTFRSSRIEPQLALSDAYARQYNHGDADTFSSVVVGELLATADGRNTWQLRADDGVRVWIGDALVLNAWKDQASWYSLSVDGLRKDQWYPIRIEYYENRGSAELKLADSSRRLLPASQLRVQPQSPWQLIEGRYGTLKLDRRGHYVYEPDPFRAEFLDLAPDQQLVDHFEVQFQGLAGGSSIQSVDITLSGELCAPLLSFQFDEDAYVSGVANGGQTAFAATAHPLLIGSHESVELRELDLLAGDNDLLCTDYGDVWFHVLDADGVRLPGSATELNPDLPTFFIVHGFLAGVGDAWLDPLQLGYLNSTGDWRLHPDDLLPWLTQYEPGHALALSLLDLYRQDASRSGANVVLVDWGNFSGKGPDYLKTATDHVPAVGQAIADYLLKHHVDPANTTLIGHSLGGHISGFAGQAVQRMAADGLFPSGTQLQRIIGMDAAGPLFNSRGPSLRLSPRDAVDVFNLHTSDTFGFSAPLATYDLYVNSDYDIQTPFTYESMVDLAELGWPSFYGAIALNLLFNPDSVSYSYDFALSALGSFLNGASGLDSHSYAVAFLAALIHEDVRLGRSSSADRPVGYRLVDDNLTPVGFYDHYWGNTFAIELRKLQETNDQRVDQGLLPLTFQSLLLGAADGGIFADVQQPTWVPGSGPAMSLDWSQEGQQGFGFLAPDQLGPSGEVPFSDYLLYWNNQSGIVDVNLDAYNWLLSPDFGSSYLNGWTSYGPGPYLEYGLLKVGQFLADLWSDPTVQNIADSVSQAIEAVDQVVDSAVSAIRSGWRWVFGGPVVNGHVFFDARQYDSSGLIVSNANLRPDHGELETQTDSIGRYTLTGLDDPSLFGNGNAVLDFRDGLVVAGAVRDDGSISLLDSISGVDMGFPLVGLPGGNITLLTTLKYAALLRWRTQWEQSLIPVTPDFITNYYATLFPNTPQAFLNDNYTPYSDLSSGDPRVVEEAIQSIEFTYSNLAIVKSIMELLRSFGLDYTNELAWGAATQHLDPTGADRVEITAFSAYGFALGQRFGQNNIDPTGTLYNPFDQVGRPAIAPVFDLDNRQGSRLVHLRELIKEVLAVYPTDQLLADAPLDVVEAYRDGRSLADSQRVDAFIESKLGPFLDRFSLGLDIILDAVHTRIATAQSLGSEFVIPGIAGPKRLVLTSLASDLVDLAANSSSVSEFLDRYLVSFYTPAMIDAPERSNSFSISISAESAALASSASWGPEQGSSLTVHILLSDSSGLPQLAPDQGLAVRLRFGGTLQEGVHYALPPELDDRTFYIPGGQVQGSFAIQLAAADIPPDSRLSIELLSADSGYGADPEHAVLTFAFDGSAPVSSGQREAFQPFRVERGVAFQPADWSLTGPSGMASPRLIAADPAQPNAVLHGVDGYPDYFLLGIPDYGLPHIENFKVEDGDRILIDRSQFQDSSREPVITDFNTYSGLVFDLVQARPLALISDYSPESGDDAWAGLSSSAGFYRFATDAELLVSAGGLHPPQDPVAEMNPQPVKRPVAPQEIPAQPEPERASVVPDGLRRVGVAAVVVRGQQAQLEVRSGEMGLGSGTMDVLLAVVAEGEETKPVLLSGGGGADLYSAMRGGLTVIADGGGGKGDVVTGLEGSVSEWSWRRIGGVGDVLLEGGEKGARTRVLLMDPLGAAGPKNRIERLEIGGKRIGLEWALRAMEQRKRMGYGELNEKGGGVLGDVLGLNGKAGRGELLDVVISNLQSVENLA